MRFTTTQMLRHLVDISSRSIRLELMKPLIQENDFIKVHKGPDGALAIENARFKTRVRASKVDPVRRSDIASGDMTCIRHCLMDTGGVPPGKWGCRCSNT